ncbi:DNA cytosine methyltransferase [Flammeovirga sp. SJP92]|uniref:DNA cytosine methyltransferase n=1 Tax=Flammeovirga sp. SJP92 TaxID=1775430 RepID=UPI00155FABB4|nr:DNA (cytosine-5-)-methyltransferase [Flammeovirga sp. SJP92]
MFNLIFKVFTESSTKSDGLGNLCSNKEYNVVSCFDGISGAQLALKNAGIKVKNYYASEIDENAIYITQKHFPNTIQVGDIKEVDKSNFKGKIDILIGGSPCQGFSSAGKRLNFDDPRSMLFFEFERLLKTLKPKYFIFENVSMNKDIEEIISKRLGVENEKVNSSLLTAQNRVRNYWTNIDFDLPEDKGIVLKDILIHKENKMSALRGRFDDNAKKYIQQLELRKDEESNTITTTLKDNLIVTNKPIKKCNLHPSGKGMRGWVYDIKGKSPTMTTNKGEGSFIANDKFLRKLTPLECERLQGFPDNYTKGISNTQRYKVLAQSFTVSIISHIFKQLI